ncbi:MAG: diguanylate cyclase [Chloroflexota bacterium]|nr:diguanylate cyclase [Chloroflexota bacterium]PLS79100.1 MAG: hypothetical protein CYG59_14985 [Chloroflexota bacterium]
MLGLKPTTTTILLVATSPMRRTVVAQQLEALGYSVLILSDEQLLADIKQVGHYDLLVVDLTGGDAQQKLTLSAYVAELMAKGTPVLMLTSDQPSDARTWTHETLNYRIGAALRNRNAADVLSERRVRYEGLHILDPETALFSRRYFDAIFPAEIERARRMHQPLTLLLIDIANGAPQPIHAWQAVSATLLTGLRQTDMLVRFNLAMVLALLPATEAALARAVANRLLKSIEMLQLDDAIRLQINIGIATFPQHGSTPEALLSTVQHAMD